MNTPILPEAIVIGTSQPEPGAIADSPGEQPENSPVRVDYDTSAEGDGTTVQIVSLDINPLETGGDDTSPAQDLGDTQPGMADFNEDADYSDAAGPEEQPGEPVMSPKTAPPQGRANATPQRAGPSDRQSFFGLDFNELDRDLSDEERQEWNSIYASYRSRSALTGTIIGVDCHTVNVRNRQTDAVEQQEMYCAIVVPFRVRIVIPETDMWLSGQERPGFVLRNMVGAAIDFVIIKVDREGGFAIASRRQAARSRRYYFSQRPALHAPRAKLKCRVLSVGPRRCLVECHGHDIGLTQREMRYTAIPDLRAEYHPGQELDCIVKAYDPQEGTLLISVKETKPNPFEGAEQRHPVGARRQAVISGKYGGGVFCNLPDGTVCMCAYAFQHEDSEFQIGDTAIIVIQRYDTAKMQIYGKIITKW